MHSAYLLQIPGMDTDVGQHLWSRVWSMKGPTRSSLFLWRVYHEGIPTQNLLFKRHIISSMYCEECEMATLGPLHELRDCHWAKRVWRKAVLPEFWETFIAADSPSCGLRLMF